MQVALGSDGIDLAWLMAGMGPFEPRPLVAAAVSGGSDSMAAAVLVRDWARGRGGDVLALVVDHGLRAESGAEARVTCARLAQEGIASDLLTLVGLRRGAGLAARARAARHACLEAACAARGILHLVFGHHADDQAETVQMRAMSGSGAAGLSAMAAIVETHLVRRLRPFLGVRRTDLRAILQVRGIDWVEDPSNTDPATLRGRLRARGGQADEAAELARTATRRGIARATAAADVAEILASRAALHREGYALLSPGPIPPDALAGLIAAISGAGHPPSSRRLARLAANPRPETVGGVRLLPAGRLGPGLLLVREEAAMAPDRPAVAGVVWDGRFRLRATPPGGPATIGAWGDAAPRDRQGLPAAILRTCPALRRDGEVIAAGPALLDGAAPVMFCQPALQAAGAAFFPLPGICG